MILAEPVSLPGKSAAALDPLDPPILLEQMRLVAVGLPPLDEWAWLETAFKQGPSKFLERLANLEEKYLAALADWNKEWQLEINELRSHQRKPEEVPEETGPQKALYEIDRLKREMAEAAEKH